MEQKQMPDVVAQNREAEAYLVQASAGRSVYFKDKFQPLTFLHFSDIHRVQPLWDRTVEYLNYYRDYLRFAVHSGDYVGGSQERYVDLIGEGPKAERPIYYCVGNHDAVLDGTQARADKAFVRQRLFPSTEGWNAKFAPLDQSMTYTVDFAAENLTMIVLDAYYDVQAQLPWLKERLAAAKTAGRAVFSVVHQPTAPIVTPIDCTFHSLDISSELGMNTGRTAFDAVLGDFIRDGGEFVCNLCGHEHEDMMGYTANGVLNVAVEAGTDWDNWNDGIRRAGTRTYDAFNVTSIDVSGGLLKLVRIGNHTDRYLRPKHVLCYDYRAKRVISNH